MRRIQHEMLSAARHEVLSARSEPGADPEIVDRVLRQLDLRSLRWDRAPPPAAPVGGRPVRTARPARGLGGRRTSRPRPARPGASGRCRSCGAGAVLTRGSAYGCSPCSQSISCSRTVHRTVQMSSASLAVTSARTWMVVGVVSVTARPVPAVPGRALLQDLAEPLAHQGRPAPSGRGGRRRCRSSAGRRATSSRTACR